VEAFLANWSEITSGEFVWGLPQYLAIAILVQRIVENFHGNYNIKRLLAQGGREVGRGFYRVVPWVHLSWVAALFLAIRPDAPVAWWLLGVYGVLQIARYTIIFTLGRYWTTRTITLDDAPVVRHGIYRYVRHPNYVVVVSEVIVMPLAFGAWLIALVWGVSHILMLGYRVWLEEKTLAPRRAAMS